MIADKIRLKYLCSKITDGSHFSPEVQNEGKHYVTVANVYDNKIHLENAKYISENAFDTLVKNGCQPNSGDILLAKDGTVGRTAIVEDNDYVILSSLGILRPNKKVSSKMLKYILDCDETQQIMKRAMAGSAIKRITINKIQEFKITVPALELQAQIAHFLDRKCTAIDTAIEKTKKSIEKLEEYKKAVITKAVTKGIDPNAKMKDSGVEWIGEIPEDWDVKQLRTYFSRRINKNIHLQEKNLLSLSYGRIVRKNIDTKEGLLPESFDGYNIVEDGDIVIRGTDLQNDHRSLRTGLVTERGIITSAYMTLRSKENVNSTYYHYLLHCYDISKVFYSMGGGLRQSLDYWEFIRMPVLHPTDREQEEIISYIKTKCAAIDAAIEKKKKAIEKLEEYKKSLIYYAVTGKIDCRNEVI